jgi:hypothetical protein
MKSLLLKIIFLYINTLKTAKRDEKVADPRRKKTKMHKNNE